MKYHRRFLSILLITALLLSTCFTSSAATYTSYDMKYSDAGASLALRHFFESNENASQLIAEALKPIESLAAAGETEAGETVTTDEILYDTPLIGKVCVESSLNVREATTVLAFVVARLYRKMEVNVIGEKTAMGRRWYKVSIDSVEGYCFADFILFGDDATTYYANLHEEEKQAAAMPTEFHVYEDTAAAGMDEATVDELKGYVNDINYTLANDYPEQAASDSYLNVYSILIYLLENYTHVRDIATEYGLEETLANCNIDMYTIELTRENLQDTTGQTEEDLQAQLAEAIAEQQANSEYALGVSIAEYAATFVGSLPYVWGGASLTHGADCSGFAAQIYAHFGLISQAAANCHAYDSGSLRSVGYAVSLDEIRPGDLVCYNGHVGIYYGGGMIVNEPAPGRKCCFSSLYCLPIICVRRLC